MDRVEIDPLFATLESTCARKKFFANDLAVLHSVNADFGHFPALFRFLVRNVSVVLHHESIVTDERPLGIEGMDFHPVHPPIDFAAHSFFPAPFPPTPPHPLSSHPYTVLFV